MNSALRKYRLYKVRNNGLPSYQLVSFLVSVGAPEKRGIMKSLLVQDSLVRKTRLIPSEEQLHHTARIFKHDRLLVSIVIMIIVRWSMYDTHVWDLESFSELGTAYK